FSCSTSGRSIGYECETGAVCSSVNNMSKSPIFLAALILAVCGLPACTHKDPETSHLVYDLSKTLSPNCSPNASCIDFQGVASFGAPGSGCTDYYFNFDTSSWMQLTIFTQYIYPPSNLSVVLTQTD